MNSKTLTILIILSIFVAFITNPSKDKHIEHIVEKIEEKAINDLGVLGETSNKTGLTKVLISDSDVNYKSYYVFSVTKNNEGEHLTIRAITLVIGLDMKY